MIFGQFGAKVAIERLGHAGDVREFEGRKPDAHDREMIDANAYVVVRYLEWNGQGAGRFLAARSRLRADGGIGEINDTIDAAQAAFETSEADAMDREVQADIDAAAAWVAAMMDLDDVGEFRLPSWIKGSLAEEAIEDDRVAFGALVSTFRALVSTFRAARRAS